MTKRIFWITAFIAVFILVISACTPATSESPPNGETEYQSNLPAVENLQEEGEAEAYPEPQGQTEPESAAVDDEAYPEPQVQPEAAAAAEEAYPTPEEIADKPAPRTELEATDPAMVSLASGEIQLVELFAFW